MSKKILGILNYGAGNFGSVKRAVESLDVEPVTVSSPDELDQITHLIFPGVGSAEQAMRELRSRGLDRALIDYAHSGRLLLGICVGMQVLGRASAEGNTECLGLLPYTIEKFRCAEPIPHMGWNSLVWQHSHSGFAEAAKSLGDETNFYFVHSYAAFLNGKEQQDSFLLASAKYGSARFAAIVADKNIWGAQCHLEKSGRAGLLLLNNFLNQRTV
jgi:imidazole glycerol phosphate synthase glutamine amidotransferase subunit